jgi:two-component system sensor histidine kinase DesK
MSKNSGLNNAVESIGSRPVFYLVYLAFYFVPWLFQAPSGRDVFAALIAIAIFIPVYFHGAKQKGVKSWPHIIAMSVIGFVVSPFFGSHGVFHIYASVQAGFIRPERFAWSAIVILMGVFCTFSLLTNQQWWDIAFPIFMGLIVSVGTISTAAKIEQQQLLERSRELEQHLAALGERERIAQDLHDLLGQTLTMVSLKSEVAIKLLETRPEQAKQEMQEIRAASRTALNDVREAVAGMNKTTVETELRRAQQILTSAKIQLTVNGEIPILNAQANQVLGLAVREAMTNIVRHSQATEAIFSIKKVDDALLVIVEDNGSMANISSEGSGLTGLRKRIEALGGQTNIQASPNVKISMKVSMSRALI